MIPASNNGPPQCLLIQKTLSAAVIAGICLGGLLGLAVVVLGILYLISVFWATLTAFAKRRAKMQGPPGDVLQAQASCHPSSCCNYVVPLSCLYSTEYVIHYGRACTMSPTPAECPEGHDLHGPHT